MTTKRLTLFLVPTLVLAVVVVPLTVRVVVRGYAIDKALHIPGFKQRVAMIPIKRTLSAPAAVQSIDLGYATFDTGSLEPISFTIGSTGANVFLANVDDRMTFSAPHGPKPAGSLVKTSALEARLHPHRCAYFRLVETDPLAAEMRIEETQLLPSWKVTTLSSDDFLLHIHLLTGKGVMPIGASEVQWIETPNAKAIVRIGLNPSDRKVADLLIASPDGSMMVGCRFTMALTTPKKIAAVLDPVIGSFRFTTDSVEDHDRIKALVHDAGISRNARAQ